MRGDHPRSAGIVDTNVIILRDRLDPTELPDHLAISAVTLAELSAGVHLVPGDNRESRLERARRMSILQSTEATFEPLPFDAAAARIFGAITASVVEIGRSHRKRVADLMIASVAAANQLPLYTTNPGDYRGLDDIVDLRAVTHPDHPAAAT